MTAALVDAGPMVALFGTRHPRAAHYIDLFRHAEEQQWSLSTTWPCVVEAGYLLSPPQRFTFLRWVAAGAITVLPLGRMEGPRWGHRLEVTRCRRARPTRPLRGIWMARQAGTISAGLIFFSTAFAVRSTAHRS